MNIHEKKLSQKHVNLKAEPAVGKEALEDILRRFTELVDIHQQVYWEGLRIRRWSKDQSLEDLVDMVFIIKQNIDIVTDIRREMKDCLNIVSRVFSKSFLEVGDFERVRGDFASGVPKPKPYPDLPKVGSQEYKDMLDQMGFPADSEAVEGNLVKFDWKKVQEHLQKCEELGTQSQIKRRANTVEAFVSTRVNTKLDLEETARKILVGEVKLV